MQARGSEKGKQGYHGSDLETSVPSPCDEWHQRALGVVQKSQEGSDFGRLEPDLMLVEKIPARFWHPSPRPANDATCSESGAICPAFLDYLLPMLDRKHLVNRLMGSMNLILAVRIAQRWEMFVSSL